MAVEPITERIIEGVLTDPVETVAVVSGLFGLALAGSHILRRESGSGTFASPESMKREENSAERTELLARNVHKYVERKRSGSGPSGMQ